MLKLWSKIEDEFLKQHWDRMLKKDIALKLQRPLRSVYDRGYKLKITKPYRVLDLGSASFNYLYRTYQREAKLRNLEFKLSLYDFKNLIQQNCHYCNKIPHDYNTYIHSGKKRKDISDKTANNAWIKMNGIDRMNSLLGYIHNNCVSCCEQCNFAKRQTSYTDFKIWIKQVHDNLFAQIQ